MSKFFSRASLGLFFIFTSQLSGAEPVGISEKSGQVFVFHGDTNGITWNRCKDFTVLQDDSACDPVETITLNENFYKAFFYFWIQRANIDKRAPLSIAEFTTLRTYLKSHDYPIMGNYLNEIVAAKKIIAKKVDYYKTQFSDSAQAADAKNEYADIEQTELVFQKAEKEFDTTLAQVKDAPWILEPSKETSFGRECLKTLSTLFEQKTLDSIFIESKSKISLNSIHLSEAIFEKSAYAYFQKLKQKLPLPTPILSVDFNGNICTFDSFRISPLQCFAQNDQTYPNLPTFNFDSVTQDIKMYSGFSKGSFVLKIGEQYLLIPTANEDYSSSFKLFTDSIHQFKVRLFDTQNFFFGPPGITENGTIYRSLLKINGLSIQPAGSTQIDTDATAITMPWGGDNNNPNAFMGCWISQKRVKCKIHEASNKVFYNPLPESGEAAKELQLPEVKSLAIAYSAATPTLTPILCSANDSTVACMLWNHKSFQLSVDAKRGIHAFLPYGSGRVEQDLVVCALGEKTMKCFQGIDHQEIHYPGITDSETILTMAKNVFGTCVLTSSKIICTPAQIYLSNKIIPLAP